MKQFEYSVCRFEQMPDRIGQCSGIPNIQILCYYLQRIALSQSRVLQIVRNDAEKFIFDGIYFGKFAVAFVAALFEVVFRQFRILSENR